MADVLLAAAVVALIIYTITAILVKKSRIERMDDTDPFDDAEWKNGSPNDPVREIAKPISSWDADDKTHYGDGGIS